MREIKYEHTEDNKINEKDSASCCSRVEDYCLHRLLYLKMEFNRRCNAVVTAMFVMICTEIFISQHTNSYGDIELPTHATYKHKYATIQDILRDAAHNPIQQCIQRFNLLFLNIFSILLLFNAYIHSLNILLQPFTQWLHST